MQIKYHAHINNTGYSIAAQDYLLSLLHVKPEIDIKLKYLNNHPGLGVEKNRQSIFNKLHNAVEDSKGINIFHSIASKYTRIPGSKCIGICVFEAINPPAFWISKMNTMDLIITPSEFNKNVFESNGVKVPIVVIPHAIDTSLFNTSVKPNGRYATKTIMSIGTWKARKNWELLIKGFYDAFEKKDNVCLLLKTNKPTELNNCVQKLKREHTWRSKDTAPIFSEPATVMSFEEIPVFMRKADYCVSASMGEGFGLFPFQAMALGIPICVTKFGGMLEYAKEEFSNYFVPASFQTHQTMDGIPQFSKCVWPTLKVSEISTKLRELVKTDNKEKASAAYRYIHENYNYNKIGSQFLKVIENV